MGPKAYDGDRATYESTPMQVDKKIKVSKEMQGKKIGVYFNGGSGSVYLYATLEDGSDKELKRLYSRDSFDSTLELPEGTVELKFMGYSASIYVYEIQTSNE